jgi:hypothetical protein
MEKTTMITPIIVEHVIYTDNIVLMIIMIITIIGE